MGVIEAVEWKSPKRRTEEERGSLGRRLRHEANTYFESVHSPEVLTEAFYNIFSELGKARGFGRIDVPTLPFSTEEIVGYETDIRDVRSDVLVQPRFMYMPEEFQERTLVAKAFPGLRMNHSLRSNSEVISNNQQYGWMLVKDVSWVTPNTGLDLDGYFDLIQAQISPTQKPVDMDHNMYGTFSSLSQIISGEAWGQNQYWDLLMGAQFDGRFVLATTALQGLTVYGYPGRGPYYGYRPVVQINSDVTA